MKIILRLNVSFAQFDIEGIPDSLCVGLTLNAKRWCSAQMVLLKDSVMASFVNDLVSRRHADELCIEADYREECEGDILDVDDSSEEGMTEEEFGRFVEIRNKKVAERLAQQKLADIEFRKGNVPIREKPLVYIKNPPLTAAAAAAAAAVADEPLFEHNMDTPMLRRESELFAEFIRWRDDIMNDIDE